jgi:glycosyltransferase involved in cell wall biosynthesis
MMTSSSTSDSVTCGRVDGPLRSVLHVLPHPGGGGETYVDTLERMGGYRFERRFIAGAPTDRRVGRAIASGLRASGNARGYDLVHVHGEAAALLSLPAFVARPSLVTLHGINVLRRTSGVKRRLATLNLRLVVCAANRTICVSEAEHDELAGAVGASLARRAVVIRNGVTLPAETSNETRCKIRGELGIEQSAVVALCVGDLDPLKDPLTPARAALALSRETELVVCFAGDGSLRSELEQLAAGEGGGALRVLGHCDDVARLYAAADIIVLASRREGLSYALLEGMSRGLAPIVSNVPGCIEAAGDAAIVVECGDVPGFAAALERLATDAGERMARGSQAYERVAHLFDADEMIARTRQLYDEVADRAEREP